MEGLRKPGASKPSRLESDAIARWILVNYPEVDLSDPLPGLTPLFFVEYYA